MKKKSKIKKEVEEIIDDVEEQIKEDIKNIPNLLTLIRVIITFVIIYMIFGEFSFTTIGILFIIGMITDGLDGYIARKFNQKTEFGRKFDMIADRFLLAGTVLAILAYNVSIGYFDRYELLMILLVMSREAIAFPFAAAAFLSRKNILPQVHVLGKLATVCQAIAFPMILFKWYLAIYFVILTSIIGIFAGLRYMNDSLKLNKK